MRSPRELLLRTVASLPPGVRNSVSHLRWKLPALNRGIAFAARRLRNCDLEIQKGVGQGLRFNAGGSAASYLTGTWQPRTQAALKALLAPGMTLYDIGANVGYFSVIGARLVGSHGAVVCFEPLAENFQQIRYNTELNGFSNIQLIEAALGKADGESLFWLSAEPTWGKLAGAGKEPDKMVGETSVLVRCLDKLVEEAKLPPPDVIKLDVEGAEVDVLEGALETIRRHRPRLLIELHGTNRAVAEILAELHYKVAVLGETTTIAEAHWNADVVAIPSGDSWPVGLLEYPVNGGTIGATA